MSDDRIERTIDTGDHRVRVRSIAGFWWQQERIAQQRREPAAGRDGSPADVRPRLET